MKTRHERRSFTRLLQKFPEALGFMRGAGDLHMGKWLAQLAHSATQNIINSLPKPLLPLKDVRLQMLADFGLNCPSFHSWKRGELREGKAVEKLYAIYVRQHRELSLRTFTEERLDEPSPRLPVLYNQRSWIAILDFCRLHNIRYHTLVNESLALRDSVCSGNIIICDENYMCAYVEGHGTPRDVDDLLGASPNASKFRMFKRAFGEVVPEQAPSGMVELALRLKEFYPDVRPITIEWSRYPYGVGQLKEKNIFWEWRGSAEHDLKVLKEYLLNLDTGYDISIPIPRMIKSA